MTEFPKHESTQPFGSLESPMDGMGVSQTQGPDDTVYFFLVICIYIIINQYSQCLSDTCVSGPSCKEFQGTPSRHCLVWCGMEMW